jgi:hypothetical protein
VMESLLYVFQPEHRITVYQRELSLSLRLPTIGIRATSFGIDGDVVEGDV